LSTRWTSCALGSKANAVHTREFEFTNGSDLVTDLTDTVAAFCRGLGDGLLNVFVPHATAGVALIEIGSGSEHDLGATIDRLWPLDVRYAHRHGSSGHGRDHVLPAFVAPSIMLPVVDGAPALGTWQSVVLVDSNVDNPKRTVRLSFVPA
jgi:secondary thiamine-phosphate synthase enzyme